MMQRFCGDKVNN